MPGIAGVGVAMLAMTLGAAVQASVGVGMALLSVPFLVLVDPRFVPGPLLLAGTALTAVVAYRERTEIDQVLFRRSLIGLALGTAIGVATLKWLSGTDLSPVFGTLVLLAIGLSIVVRAIVATPCRVLAGASVAGIMGAMVGMPGPAISLVFQSTRPARVRAMLNAFATASNLIGMAALVSFGLFGRREVLLGLALLPGVLVGGYVIAPLLVNRVGRRTLRPAILIIAAAGGIGLLWQ